MEDSWTNLKVSINARISDAIFKLGFKTMTPVQSVTIPHFLQRKDVAVEAITGSGKTLAFIIPMLQMLIDRETPLKKHEIGGLILTPTRELAIQIHEVLSHFLTELTQFSSLLLIGGEEVNQSIQKYTNNGCNIIIATPGRMEDLFNRKLSVCNLSSAVKSLEVLVLDEADRLLDMGFEMTINTILGYLPKQRRTGLFSATQTDEVENLIRAGLRNPLRISVKEKKTSTDLVPKTPTLLQNFYMIVEADDKLNQLITFLRQHKKEKIIVFFSTCAAVNYFKKAIELFVKNCVVYHIHGKLKQKRTKVIQKLKNADSGILVCTDLMARGIDIPDIHWVIQFDPPSSSRAFVHRCGRTARIGNKGNALVFLLPNEETYVSFLKINQRTPMTVMDINQDATNIIPKFKKLVRRDRALYESGMKAFVSFIQFYSKHECSMIFKTKELDIGKLATGYALIQLPKMPELKGKEVKGFLPEDIDTETIIFKDKGREKQRQEIKQKIESGEMLPKKKNFKSKPWSDQKARKEKRKENREKRQRKKKRKKEEMNEEDLNELDDDMKLIKKFKKGKMSKADLDKGFDDALD